MRCMPCRMRLCNKRYVLMHNFVPRRVVAMAALGNRKHCIPRRAIKEQRLPAWRNIWNSLRPNSSRLAGVHWAHDAAEARSIIATSAQQTHTKVVVKGVHGGQEIHLNPFLRNTGRNRHCRPLCVPRANARCLTPAAGACRYSPAQSR